VSSTAFLLWLAAALPGPMAGCLPALPDGPDGPGPRPAAAAADPVSDRSAPAVPAAGGERLARLVDLERARAGAGPLRWDPVLAAVARAHSRDMAARGRLSHEGSDGRRLRGRVDDPSTGLAGRWRDIAEILAANDYGDPEATAVAGWLRSPPHRRSMLGAQYALAGAGAARDARGQWYFTVVFLLPR